MINRIKARWQAWLDGSMSPLYPEKPQRPAAPPDFFAGTPAERPAQGLRPARPDHDTVTMTLRALREDDTVAMPAVEADLPFFPGARRAYEAELGPIAAALLDDLDQTFTRLLADRERTTVWTKIMVNRRSARNQQAAVVDVAHLFRDDVPGGDLVDLLRSRITARALHASDPDADTGLIPLTEVALVGVAEEDTA